MEYFNTLFRSNNLGRLQELLNEFKSDERFNEDRSYKWGNSSCIEATLYEVGATNEVHIHHLEEDNFKYLMVKYKDLDILTFDWNCQTYEVYVKLYKKGCISCGPAYGDNFPLWSGSENKLAGFYDSHYDIDRAWFYDNNPDVNCDATWEHHSGGWEDRVYNFPWKQYWRSLAGQYKTKEKSGIPKDCDVNFNPETLYTEENIVLIMYEKELRDYKKTGKISKVLEDKIKNRLKIGYLLSKGCTYEVIEDLTGFSSATISKVAKYFYWTDFAKVFEKLEKEI